MDDSAGPACDSDLKARVARLEADVIAVRNEMTDVKVVLKGLARSSR